MDRDEQRNFKEENPLPFGEGRCIAHSNVSDFTDSIAPSVPGLLNYDAACRKAPFFAETAALKIKDLSLTASRSTAVAFSVKEGQGLYFVLATSGSAVARIGQDQGIVSHGEIAFLSPEQERSGATTAISMLQASMTQEKLLGVAEIMFRSDLRPVFQNLLARPQNLSIRDQNAGAASFIMNMCRQIDAFDMNVDLLTRLGFDGALYRAIVLLMTTEDMLAREEFAANAGNSRAVRRVVEFIDANIGTPLTLTQLEAISGIGGRALQYAFMKTYGVTPMSWVRDRRLEVARRELLKADPDQTVTAIALRVGWANLNSFPSSYFKRYGETPSQTLRKRSR